MSSTLRTPNRSTRRKLRTRDQLIRAAHQLMSTKGVDETTINEITELADLGFGTFYNYFSSKDGLAAQVLDCVIDDLGKRNDLATSTIKPKDPDAVQAISIRLTMREMMTNPMWRWWFNRPDLLVSRMHHQFYKYGVRDLKISIESSRYDISIDDVDAVWSQQMWMLVGGIKEMLDDLNSTMTETRLIETIMRAMGVPSARARELSKQKLPVLPKANIDFAFNADPELREVG
ncbi:TetR/AcrR family transcriptional regulator [Pseudomonadota bacterium]